MITSTTRIVRYPHSVEVDCLEITGTVLGNSRGATRSGWVHQLTVDAGERTLTVKTSSRVEAQPGDWVRVIANGHTDQNLVTGVTFEVVPSS